MRVLSLIIKKQYADEILNRSKKEETRIIKSSNYKKYLVANPDTGSMDFRHYDAINLFVGYHTNRTRILITIESIHSDFRSEKLRSALANGVSVNIVYKLGDIIEYSN